MPLCTASGSHLKTFTLIGRDCSFPHAVWLMSRLLWCIGAGRTDQKGRKRQQPDESPNG
jgi:hypothetical protein